jgi:hypothetical protein
MSNPPPIPPSSGHSSPSYTPSPGFNPAMYGSGGYEPPRTNGFAVAGLVASLFVCCVGIHAVVGLVLSGVGLATSKKTNSGKGMSIAGLVISLVMLVIWAGVGVFTYSGYQRYVKPMMDTAQGFVGSLEKGDYATAQKFTTGKITAEKLQSLAEQVKSMGKYQTVINPTGVTIDTPEGKEYDVKGLMVFTGGSLKFHARVSWTNDNKIKIISIDLTDPAAPSTLPSTAP